MSMIVLIRHGETEWNRSGQIMGARPVPLNVRGESQAERLARFLARWASPAGPDPSASPAGPPLPRLTGDSCRLISSPVCRAMQTATILGRALDLTVQPDAGLSEIGVGEWEGRFWNELGEDSARRRYYAHPSDARPPGGETFREVQARAVAVIDRAMRGQRQGIFLCVSHADVIRSIMAHLLGLLPHHTREMRIDHTSLTGLSLEPGPSALLFLNYVVPDIHPTP